MIISTIINFIIMNFCDICYTCRVNVRSKITKITKLLAPPKYD